jgi:transposase
MGVQRAKKTQGGFGWERGRPGFAWHRRSAESRRLETIPGVGYITATAIAATVTDPAQFRSGREFAAWLGLTPRQNSSGGKERLGRISKMGGGYLRTLLCGRCDGSHALRTPENRSRDELGQWPARDEAGPS